jgi:hypothetical protein
MPPLDMHPLRQLRIERDVFRGDWNYVIRSRQQRR